MLVSSGEPLPEQLFRQLQEVLPADLYVLNIYGCTEVSADATCCCLQEPLGETLHTDNGSVVSVHMVLYATV